jgi:hypothetical protein
MTLEPEDSGILIRPDFMSMTSHVTRRVAPHCCAFRKLVAQMMIYDHAFGVFRVNNGRTSPTSLINNYNMLGMYLRHRLSLIFFMDIRTFLYEVYRDQGWIEAQCNQGAVDNNPSAQPIRILVWDNQSALLSRSTAVLSKGFCISISRSRKLTIL